jgi:hypothetical protein
MHQPSTTFKEHIKVLAAESTCALVLEWGRRLELAVKNFARVVGVSEGPWRKYVEALRNDPLVGEEILSEISRLRSRRNKVAHETPRGMAAHDATEFARKAEEIVWLLGRVQDVREGVDQTWSHFLESSFPASGNK